MPQSLYFCQKRDLISHSHATTSLLERKNKKNKLWSLSCKHVTYVNSQSDAIKSIQKCSVFFHWSIQSKPKKRKKYQQHFVIFKFKYHIIFGCFFHSIFLHISFSALQNNDKHIHSNSRTSSHSHSCTNIQFVNLFSKKIQKRLWIVRFYDLFLVYSTRNFHVQLSPLSESIWIAINLIAPNKMNSINSMHKIQIEWLQIYRFYLNFLANNNKTHMQLKFGNVEKNAYPKASICFNFKSKYCLFFLAWERNFHWMAQLISTIYICKVILMVELNHRHMFICINFAFLSGSFSNIFYYWACQQSKLWMPKRKDLYNVPQH